MRHPRAVQEGPITLMLFKKWDKKNKYTHQVKTKRRLYKLVVMILSLSLQTVFRGTSKTAQYPNIAIES